MTKPPLRALSLDAGACNYFYPAASAAIQLFNFLGLVITLNIPYHLLQEPFHRIL